MVMVQPVVVQSHEQQRYMGGLCRLMVVKAIAILTPTIQGLHALAVTVLAACLPIVIHRTLRRLVRCHRTNRRHRLLRYPRQRRRLSRPQVEVVEVAEVAINLHRVQRRQLSYLISLSARLAILITLRGLLRIRLKMALFLHIKA